MKFEIYIGKRGPQEWTWELSYEERRPYYSRPVTLDSGPDTLGSFGEAKREAEAEALAIANRTKHSSVYTFEVVL